MQPGNMPMALRRNAVDAVRLQLEDVNGPMNIAGYSLKLDVRLYPGAPGAPQLTLSSSDGGIAVEDALKGIVEIDWPAVSAAIRALPSAAEAGDPAAPRVDTFAYDLLLIAPDGTSQAVLEGTVPVSFGVTQQ